MAFQFFNNKKSQRITKQFFVFVFYGMWSSIFSQTTWRFVSPTDIIGPVTFEITEPLEINGSYVVLNRWVVYNGTIPRQVFKLRKFDTQGNIVKTLYSDSIMYLRTNDFFSATLVPELDAWGRIELLTKESRGANAGVAKRMKLDDQFDILVVDSIRCTNCSDWNTLNFTDVKKTSSNVYYTGGSNGAYFGSALHKLDFIHNLIEFRAFGTFQYGSFLHEINSISNLEKSHSFWSFTDGLYPDLIFHSKNLTVDSAFTAQFLSNSGMIYVPCELQERKENEFLSACIFLNFSLSDTGRVGLMVQDSVGHFVDSVAIVSSINQWYDIASLDTSANGIVYLGGSHYHTGTARSYKLGTIDIHRLRSDFTVDWSLQLGQRYAYVLLHLKATSNGGVIAVSRFYDQGMYKHELVYLDSNGTVISAHEWNAERPSLIIYPNPSSSGFTVYDEHSEFLHRPLVFELRNEWGVVVWRKEHADSRVQRLHIPIEGFSSGLYVLTISGLEHGVISEKLWVH